jgi:hypothetical protein
MTATMIVAYFSGNVKLYAISEYMGTQDPLSMYSDEISYSL